MKATRHLKELLVHYYVTNDVEILEDITEYLGIDWAEFVIRSEIVEENIDFYRFYLNQEKTRKADNRDARKARR